MLTPHLFDPFHTSRTWLTWATAALNGNHDWVGTARQMNNNIDLTHLTGDLVSKFDRLLDFTLSDVQRTFYQRDETLKSVCSAWHVFPEMKV